MGSSNNAIERSASHVQCEHLTVKSDAEPKLLAVAIYIDCGQRAADKTLINSDLIIFWTSCAYVVLCVLTSCQEAK